RRRVLRDNVEGQRGARLEEEQVIAAVQPEAGVEAERGDTAAARKRLKRFEGGCKVQQSADRVQLADRRPRRQRVEVLCGDGQSRGRRVEGRYIAEALDDVLGDHPRGARRKGRRSRESSSERTHRERQIASRETGLSIVE